MVIFMSDNGAPFVNSKTTLYDAGVRLPLIISSPDPDVVAGTVNPNMVSFLDILPTCITWTGSKDLFPKTNNSEKSPKRLGRSLLPILNASKILPEKEWQQHVFGSHTFHEIQNYWPTRYMRTHRFKYHRNIAWQLNFPFGTDLYGSLSLEGIRNSTPLPDDESDTPEVMLGRCRLTSYVYRGPEELFDLEADPEEINNLANDPKYQDQLVHMRSRRKHGNISLTTYGFSRMVFDFDIKRPGNASGPFWAPAKPKEAIYDESKDTWVPPASWLSLFNSLNYIGFAAGVVIGYYVSARWGRRICMFVMSIYALGTATIAVTSMKKNQIMAARELNYIYVGMELAVVPAYQSEIVPAPVRGLIVGTYQFALILGGLVINCVCIGTSHLPDNRSWRIPLGLFYLIPIIIAIGIWFLPESPRWLLQKGRVEDARTNLVKFRSGVFTEEEIAGEF
ncbi:hypothetical protein NW762_001304 [Fusarium torreyae]|uniref:Major facilitator superfamily (MFS) profile domain-containing protein n=1 Tax=Fusarium torreyae TaxID=1237075 RepID=A0A9W8SDT8_9HYPO|nr:hypothetical protein NW762_001304 [Fusarium torreyae]